MSSTEEDSGTPILPSDSPGSSVSEGLMDEYQELLKYAVITPHFDPSNLPKTIAEAVHAYQTTKQNAPVYVEEDSESSSERSSTSTLVDSSSASQSQAPKTTTPHCPPLQQEVLTQPTDKWYPSPHVSKWSGTDGDLDLSTETGDHVDSTVSNSPASTLNTPSIDPDLARMEAELDGWSLGLKRQVLAELSQAKLKLLHRHRQTMQVENNRHAQEINDLRNELASLQELLHTYQQSTERKDGVITNLTNAMQKQKQRFEMLKKFNSWKLRHSEDRREVFTSSLARKHNQRQLMQKVWVAWRGIIEAKWKQRVEKACQAKAQEVCMALTNDYEAKIASANEALESSRQEVARLHAERDHYEEAMKKAFMRGVCALNMEAMSMFHQADEEDGGSVPQVPFQQPPNDCETSRTRPHHTHRQEAEPNLHSARREAGFSAPTYRGGKTVPPYKTGSKPRVVVAKVTGRDTAGRVGLAPTKASVVVERHAPINQQTIGHAQASRQPARTSTVPSRT